MTLLTIQNSSASATKKNGDELIVVSYDDSNFLQTLEKLSDASIDEATVTGIYPSDELLGELFRLLKPKKKVSFHQCIKDREAGQTLTTDLKVHGFLDIMVAKDPTNEERFAICEKPTWNLGDSAQVNIEPLRTRSQSTWKMAVDDENENDMIDENELLNDGIVPKAPVSDCGTGDATGKKRACANCTCGLAELEALEGSENVANASSSSASKSGCGNCSKGDAFRCAGCPFLGKPAFQPGQEKLVLAMTDDL
jgi:hypothetical protein